MKIEFEFSGLERLQKVLRKIDGSKTYNFRCEQDGVLSKADQGALALEALQHLIGDEAAQRSFLNSGCFSYHSALAGNTLRVAVTDR